VKQKHRKNFPTYSNGHELKKGTCRICGCTEGTSCTVELPTFGTSYSPRHCSWTDKTKTLCDAPHCVKKDAELFTEYTLGDSLRHAQIWICQEIIGTIENAMERFVNARLEKHYKAGIRKQKKEIKRLEHLTSMQIIELYHEHQKRVKC